jgi:tetratricopeptide (TPR) repeat protein
MKHIAILALLASVASADSANKKRADQLFADGRRYLQTKEYALACTAFEQSQQADPAIGTQLNIALCYEEWGHVVAALHAFEEAERLATAKKDNRAKEAHKKVEELGPKVPRLAVSVPASTDPSAMFLLDGKEIERAALTTELLLEVGDHAIEVRVPGSPPKTTKLALAIGEHKRLELDVPKVVVAPPPLPPPPVEPPRKKNRLYAAIGLGGGGVLALGTASIVALVARSDYANAISSCPNYTCTTKKAYDQTQTARSHADVATGVAIGGLALVGAGVYLFLTSRGERRVSAAPLLSPGAVGVAIGGPL